jgi:hypothetical protein
MVIRILLWLTLAACLPPQSGEKPWKVATLAVPEIANTDLYCDLDTAKWQLEVEATAWTGGGSTVWTVDGTYVETHAVNSFSAAKDGTDDLLKLTLKIVADWREVKSGSATTFKCAEDPNVLFVLRETEGDVVDCAAFGPEPEIWNDVDGVSPCE